MSTGPEQWIAPRLTDGLGNRLFQLAAAHQAASRWGLPLAFALPKSQPASHGSWDTIFRMFPDIPTLWDLSGCSSYVFSQTNCFEHLEFPERTPGERVILRGLPLAAAYIHPRFPQPSWSTLVPDLDTFLKSWNLETREKQMKTIFLHVRLGDYLKLPHHQVGKLPHHQVGLISYYAKSLCMFEEDMRVLIFSDEIERAKQIPLFDSSFTFVTEADEGRALCLMSHCLGGAITANSTFSWWGAYFAHMANPSGHVTCMPSKWMATDVNTDGVYPSWAIKVSVD